jgi:hypothetical protein
MSTWTGSELPEHVGELFSGHHLGAGIGSAYLMVTVDPDRRPRPCMLSLGEILAVDRRTLRLAVWTGSHTSANLAAGSSVLLCVLDESGAVYVRGRAYGLTADGAREMRLDCFEFDVTSAESDAHDGMPIRHGITYSVIDSTPEVLLDTWRAQLQLLRSAQRQR